MKLAYAILKCSKSKNNYCVDGLEGEHFCAVVFGEYYFTLCTVQY